MATALKDIKPNAKNPRILKKPRAEKLAYYLDKFGDLSGIVYNVNPECEALVSGHQRVRIFKKEKGKLTILERFSPPTKDGTVTKGFIELANGQRYTYTEKFWSKEEADEATIVANGQFGEWDGDVLANDWFQFEVPQLIEMGVPEFVFGGFEPAMEKKEAQQDNYQMPAEIVTDIERGDLITIGPHRLFCGDSTNPDDVKRLMGAAKADLTITSPPYWVGKDYEREKTWPDIQAFIKLVSANLVGLTKDDGRIVINTGTCQAGKYFDGVAQMRLLLDDWQHELDKLGWPMRYVRCWAKRGQLPLISPKMDVIDVHWEFLGYFYNPKAKPFKGHNKTGESWSADGIWEIPGDRSAGGAHVAAFPVEIPARNILLFSQEGDVVADLFNGAGTTMVAAHQLERICYGMEIEPKYCEATVDRMLKQDPTLEILRNGKPYIPKSTKNG